MLHKRMSNDDILIPRPRPVQSIDINDMLEDNLLKSVKLVQLTFTNTSNWCFHFTLGSLDS